MKQKRGLIFFGALIFALTATLGGFWLLRGRGSSDSPARQAAQPGIAYLSPVAGSEVWLQELDGSPPRQLTHTGGRVTGLEALKGGDWLAAVVANDQGGSDLFLASWDGSRVRPLVECGADLCAGPSASADGRWLAFTRHAPGANFPTPWLIDLATGAAQPLENDTLIGAQSFSWSPDSQHLAFYDPASGGVRVRDMDSGSERVLQTNMPLAGSWSADSRLLTVNIEEAAAGFASMKVYLFDTAAGTQQLLLGSAPDDASDYGAPQWSPDGQWLAYSRRALTGNPAKQIWIIRPDGSGARAVTDNLSQAHGGYRWSPDSAKLVFQRLALGSSGNLPAVVVWDLASGEFQTIAEDAASPVWLP